MLFLASVRRCVLALLLVAPLTNPCAAQRPAAQLDSAAILHRIEKLGVVGSVLYLGAHPDDENTRLLTYLSNGRKVRTAYLSLTRGDGGQNLIGTELGDALGVLRTQELLEARRIDGGEQFFTRAVDFGFSKSPDESFAKWGRQEILGDVVRVLREFRPDVIVTRFATDGSGGHGHHTASALLAQEAFDLAADPRAFPEQLAQGLEPWQTRRLFFNASTWWSADLPEKVKQDPARWVALDVGGFDALLGASYTELAGRSRSQHKSQGFGAAETRGALTEYLRLEKGAPLAQPELFDGIDTTWSRVAGAERALALQRELVASYELRAPEKSVPLLAQFARALDEAARMALAADAERAWLRVQAQAARELALQACGIVVEATANVPSVAAGDSVKVSLSILQRRPGPKVELVGFGSTSDAAASNPQELVPNTALVKELVRDIPATQAIDEPYWLAQPHDALYRVNGDRRGIEPASASALVLACTLRFEGGFDVRVERPLMHKWVDRVAGERTRAVVVTPVASLELDDRVALARGSQVRISAGLVALRDGLAGALRVRAPEGWTVEELPAPIDGLKRGERREFEIALRRGANAAGGSVHLSFEGPLGASDRTRHVVDHPHVLPQTWYSPADVSLVPLDVEVSVRTVGYIEGAGDDVPAALRRLGITLERIDPARASAADLARCDAIVTGIRAYNTVRALARLQPLLMDYVAAGGTLLVQYNTNGDDLVIDAKKLGPYPFVLTRERVTLEDAPPTFLAPAHALLTTPNVLGAADFAGWVQERGLYFTGELDARYTPLVAWNDPGEKPLNGGWITCEFGAGRYTYIGLSLFRQWPAGVPGAYRLLANLLARRAASPSDARAGGAAAKR